MNRRPQNFSDTHGLQIILFLNKKRYTLEFVMKKSTKNNTIKKMYNVLQVWHCITFMIKFVSDLRQVISSSPSTSVSSTNKNWPPQYKWYLIMLAVIGTNCICSCESNYHTITITKIYKRVYAIIITRFFVG